MDIFDFALQRERESETFYRTLAAGCKDAAVAGVLARLADAEVRHQEVVTRMKQNASVAVADDPFLQDVKKILTGVRDRRSVVTEGMSQLDLYRKAQSFEKEAWDLYEEAAAKAKTAAAKAILHRLSAQERVHYHVLETIVELVSRPIQGNWLENAEWYHLDSY